MQTVAIVNPVAGRRQAHHKWLPLLEASGRLGARVVTWWTEGPGHAEGLAARARREGFQRVVAVGGDGTLFEVANGLWWEPQGALPSLGMVPLGTGCDYVRNFSLNASLQEHLLTALSEPTAAVSAGVFRCAWPGAAPRPQIFLNHLGAGFDANVVAHMRQWRLPFRGKPPYFLAGLREMVSLKSYHFRGTVDGAPVDTEAAIFVAGLGRSFGGGLLITPQASPQAQRFQALWITGVSRLGLLKMFAGGLAGKPLLHPGMHTARPRKVMLTSDPPAWIEAEGELVGQTPLEVEVRAHAFQVAIHGI